MIPSTGLRVNFLNRMNGYVSGQKGIQILDQSFIVYRAFGIEMKILSPAVDTRVGSATAHDAYFTSENFTQSFLHHFLHTLSIGLRLPAVVMGAEIGDGEKVAHAGFKIKDSKS